MAPPRMRFRVMPCAPARYLFEIVSFIYLINHVSGDSREKAIKKYLWHPLSRRLGECGIE